MVEVCKESTNEQRRVFENQIEDGKIGVLIITDKYKTWILWQGGSFVVQSVNRKDTIDMIKQIMGAAMGMLLLSVQCFAMTFSQPIEIGKIGGLPSGGFWIHGADYNNGTSFQKGEHDKRWNEILYEKGVARFGTSDKGLWVYYDCSFEKNRKYWEAYSPKFGDEQQMVTVSLGAGEGDHVDINQIPNNEGVTMYFLAHYGCVAGNEIYVIMGYDKKGKFVKYIDIRDAVRIYLGEKRIGMKGIWLRNYYCRGDSIIIEYLDPWTRNGYTSPAGAFRFKWDDNAQWFGVEHVLY